MNDIGMIQSDGLTGPAVVETTTATFAQDVIAESQNVPVLVDFWAPWCGPCKQLAPVLEAAVAASRGAVRLVKMNIDDHPEIAGQLGVKSIPAVIAFKNGQPLDGFMGAVPEQQIKSFIERIAGPVGPSEVETIIEAANQSLAAEDYETALQGYATALQMEPENCDAIGGLAQSLVAMGQLTKAEEVLSQLPDGKENENSILAARAALNLAHQASELGDLAELMAKVDQNPDDYQARLDLALGLNAGGRQQEAIDQLIKIVKRDREWDDSAARKQLLQFFEAWGPSDEMTVYGRRNLSSVLFS